MAQQVGSQKETIADALARRVEAGRGGAPRWAEAFRELAVVDRAVYDAVARTLPGGVGHNLPREAPRAFADAIVEVGGY